MPPPHRLAPAIVTDLLERWFPDERILVPSSTLSRHVVRRCNDDGVTGGAVYDALIGFTVAEAGATLVTRDVRAVRTYRRLGVEIQLMS